MQLACSLLFCGMVLRRVGSRVGRLGNQRRGHFSAISGQAAALWLPMPHGVRMQASSSDHEYFVNLAALGEFFQALEGKKRIPEVQQGLRLEVALRALEQGMSLAEILHQAIRQLEKSLILRALEVTR